MLVLKVKRRSVCLRLLLKVVAALEQRATANLVLIRLLLEASSIQLSQLVLPLFDDYELTLQSSVVFVYFALKVCNIHGSRVDLWPLLVDGQFKSPGHGSQLFYH